MHHTVQPAVKLTQAGNVWSAADGSELAAVQVRAGEHQQVVGADTFRRLAVKPSVETLQNVAVGGNGAVGFTLVFGFE